MSPVCTVDPGRRYYDPGWRYFLVLFLRHHPGAKSRASEFLLMN